MSWAWVIRACIERGCSQGPARPRDVFVCTSVSDSVPYGRSAACASRSVFSSSAERRRATIRRMGKLTGMRRLLPFVLTLSVAGAACSDDEPKESGCKPEQADDCDEGLVCEQVGAADNFSCVEPVVVSGRVFGALDGAGLVGATVVGLDVNGAARTRVVRSGSNGAYELPISVARNADGTPTAESITLRVAAADHQPFATAPRTALPIELSSGQHAAGSPSRGRSPPATPLASSCSPSREARHLRAR